MNMAYESKIARFCTHKNKHISQVRVAVYIYLCSLYP